jgi:hypothetical protein
MYQLNTNIKTGKNKIMKITTTLQKIYDCDPCSSGWKKLLKHLLDEGKLPG